MGLAAYNKMRRFSKTPEPAGKPKASTKRKKDPIFVVHMHDASHLHYDIRLEIDGVLKSWAVPKGPINDPKERRLAARTEDHPFAYRTFEGVIPEGEYGAGPSMLWDRGTFHPIHQEKFTAADVKKGTLEFELHGEKMKGIWVLFRFKQEKGKEYWILKKAKKGPPAGPRDLIRAFPRSVKSDRTIEEIRHDG